MQTGVQYPRAARQLAVQPAQQNPRRRPAHRSLLIRRANPPRRIDEAFRRIKRCRRPLHRLPPLRETLPGEHRFRRRNRCHPQLPTPIRQTQIQPRRGRRYGLFERQRPAHHQCVAQRRGRSRFQTAKPRLPMGQKIPHRRRQTKSRAESHYRRLTH